MEVIPFSEDTLSKALSNHYTSTSAIREKDHFAYLLNYLDNGVFAKTIVIEQEYISKDFLHDYSSYYSLCFEKYPKFCKRVHFFALEFDKEIFQNFILGERSDLGIRDSYLGFIVVKPIPTTVIGFTLLKTYSNSAEFNARNFWGLKDYTVHLYGTELKVQSLAFQEQDSVLAACATTAIWSMLSKAIDVHTAILKSPSQITKDAGNISFDGSRLFPNKGLNILQICEAIYQSGLVSEVKQPDIQHEVSEEETIDVISASYLKKILNAYSPIGIPIILVISVPNGEEHGLHAVTVSGYIQNAPEEITPGPEMSFQSDKIIKFYAHDDQKGPFVRIDFYDEFHLNTPWSTGVENSATIVNIIIPLYPKIRISYEDIEVVVRGFDTILTLFFDSLILSDLVWDIKIEFSQNFKKYVSESLDLAEFPNKIDYLKKSLPRYIWTAACYIGQFRILKFTFDATGVSNGMLGLDVVSHLPDEVRTPLKEFIESNKGTDLENAVGREYYQFFIDNIN